MYSAKHSQIKKTYLLGGVVIGLLIPLAWVGTGLVLQDEFDPIPVQALTFTSSGSDTLFWLIASSSISAGFGVGLIAGVLAGSALFAVSTKRFQWVSFSSPRETGRYLAGAVMMGTGGVFAGGCTVGAGLSGIASMSFAAMLILGFIILGAKIAQLSLANTSKTHGFVGEPATMQ